MSSRDGVEFRRWDEPVIPTTAPKDRDGNRGNYMAWGMLPLPGDQRNLSVYATEGNRKFGPTRVRRFTYRVDGFVGIVAGKTGGELLTRPLLTASNNLVVNYKVQKGGSLRAELQDADGRPLKGFALADCKPLVGDEIEASIEWSGTNPQEAMRSFRIRFVLENATLYSMRCKATSKENAK